MSLKTSEKIRLIKAVFSVEPGKSLLDELEKELTDTPLFNKDPYKMYWRTSKLDSLYRWRNFANMSEKDLADLIEKERQAENEQKTLESDLDDFLY